jgi:integrase
MQAVLAEYERSRVISAGYAYQLRLTVDSFTSFLGRAATKADLNRDTVNDWLLALERAGTSPRTLRGQRGNLLCLWRDACDNDRALVPPHKIRCCPIPDQIIDGFSSEDMRAVLKACEVLRGTFRGTTINRRDYFRSFLLFGWDTALRLGDVLSVERSWVWPGGYISIVQSKTGQAIRKQLQPGTVAAIEENLRGSDRSLIWPLWGRREAFFAAFRSLVKRAELRGGTSKWIRRGSATAVEIIKPGSASKHLGHKSPGLAEKHYLIKRLLPADGTLPPSLV